MQTQCPQKVKNLTLKPYALRTKICAHSPHELLGATQTKGELKRRPQKNPGRAKAARMHVVPAYPKGAHGRLVCYTGPMRAQERAVEEPRKDSIESVRADSQGPIKTAQAPSFPGQGDKFVCLGLADAVYISRT
eukprot:scaffold319321_cov17-Tisochrysis_lutea.AAC.1